MTKERHSTFVFPILQQGNTHKQMLSNKKAEILNTWRKEAVDVVNMHLDLVRETGRKDRDFHHKMLYDKIRVTCPNLPASSLKHIMNGVLGYTLERQPDLEHNSDRFDNYPVYLDKYAVKFFINGESFPASIKIGLKDGIIFPLVGENTKKKLREIGILEDQVELDKTLKVDKEIQEFSNQMKGEKYGKEDTNSHKEKMHNLRNIQNDEYNSQGYRLVRLFLLKKHHKWFLYVTVVKKPEKQIGGGGSEIVRDETYDAREEIQVEDPAGMANFKRVVTEEPNGTISEELVLLKSPEVKAAPSRTVVRRVKMLPNYKDRKNLPNEVRILTFPNWEASDYPESERQKNRPGWKMKRKVSGMKHYAPLSSWHGNDKYLYDDGLGLNDFITEARPFCDFLLDPSNRYQNLRLFGVEVLKKGLLPVKFTRVSYCI